MAHNKTAIGVVIAVRSTPYATKVDVATPLVVSFVKIEPQYQRITT